MSRIRSIKPEFWTSAEVMALPRDARLLFIGIWNFADDHGRFKWAPETIRVQLMPNDRDVTDSMVAEWMDLLAEQSLLYRYERAPESSGGLRKAPENYGVVTGWHHQRVSHRAPSKLPDPQACSPFAAKTPESSGELQSPPESSGLICLDLPRSTGRARASAPLQVEQALIDAEQHPENGPPPVPNASRGQSFDDLVRAEAFKRDIKPTPTLTQNQRTAAIKSVLEYGGDKQLGFERAAKELISQAFDDADVTGDKFCFALADAVPGRPRAARFNRPGTAPPERELSKPAQDAEAMAKKMRDEGVFF